MTPVVRFLAIIIAGKRLGRCLEAFPVSNGLALVPLKEHEVPSCGALKDEQTGNVPLLRACAFHTATGVTMDNTTIEQDERLRLVEVDRLTSELSSGSDPVLNSVVSMLCAYFNVPIALVSIIDRDY